MHHVAIGPGLRSHLSGVGWLQTDQEQAWRGLRVDADAEARGFLGDALTESDLRLFLGSYPITPASDILHELVKHKHFGVKSLQAEDEIAAMGVVCGASFAGARAMTTTSGPGMSLKSELI